MPSQDTIKKIANSLLEQQGLKVATYKLLQGLWAGYGHICHIQAVPIDDRPSQTNKKDRLAQPLILKIVTPPATESSRNGKHKSLDEGHIRKVMSYQVEQHFYADWAPQMPREIAPVAECIASTNEQGPRGELTIAMAMTDLRQSYPVAGEKRGELDETQVYAALKWLAEFHGFWWQKAEGIDRGNMRLPPLEEAKPTRSSNVNRLWLNGGYT